MHKFTGALNSNIAKKKRLKYESANSSVDLELTGFREPNRNPISSKNNELTVRSFPVLFWFFGFLITFFALFLTANMILGPENAYIKSFSQRKWWEILIIVVIFVIGVSLFIMSKYERIDFDKEVNHCYTL